MKILDIIFWVFVLIGWAATVAYAINMLESILDTLLDRWFESEPVEHNENPWPDYKE